MSDAGVAIGIAVGAVWAKNAGPGSPGECGSGKIRAYEISEVELGIGEVGTCSGRAVDDGRPVVATGGGKDRIREVCVVQICAGEVHVTKS